MSGFCLAAVSVELGKESIAEAGVGGLGVEGDGGEDPSTLKLRRDRGERTEFSWRSRNVPCGGCGWNGSFPPW